MTRFCTNCCQTYGCLALKSKLVYMCGASLRNFFGDTTKWHPHQIFVAFACQFPWFPASRTLLWNSKWRQDNVKTIKYGHNHVYTLVFIRVRNNTNVSGSMGFMWVCASARVPATDFYYGTDSSHHQPYT